MISSTVVQTGGLFQAVGLFMWTITFGISTLSGSWGSWLLIHHDQFGDCVDRWLSKVPTDNWRDVEASGLRRPCLMCSSPGATSLGRPSSKMAAVLDHCGLPGGPLCVEAPILPERGLGWRRWLTIDAHQ